MIGGLGAELCLTLATPWTIACQASQSMRFPRQEYWSELPFPSSRDFPNPEIESEFPALQAVFTAWATRFIIIIIHLY